MPGDGERARDGRRVELTGVQTREGAVRGEQKRRKGGCGNWGEGKRGTE